MGRARPIAGMSRAAIGSAAAIGSKGEGSGAAGVAPAGLGNGAGSTGLAGAGGSCGVAGNSQGANSATRSAAAAAASAAAALRAGRGIAVPLPTGLYRNRCRSRRPAAKQAPRPRSDCAAMRCVEAERVVPEDRRQPRWRSCSSSGVAIGSRLNGSSNAGELWRSASARSNALERRGVRFLEGVRQAGRARRRGRLLARWTAKKSSPAED